MRRIWLLPAAGAFSLGVAAGCTNVVATPPAAVEGANPAHQSVTYWYQHSGARERALKALIGRFNAANPWGVTVHGEYAGSYADLYDKMVTSIAAGSMPDIVVAYQDQVSMYEAAGAVIDLNPFVASPKWGIGPDLADFYHGFLAQDVYPQFGGKRLGFPPNRSLEVLFYNKEWLNRLGTSEAPSSWGAFAELARRAAGGGRYGYDITTDASDMFAQVVSRGGAIADGKGYTLDTPEMRDSMAYMRELYRTGTASRVAEQFGDQTDFGNGRVLFTFGSTSGIPFYDQAVRAGSAPFVWGIAAIPHTTQHPRLDIYGASLSVMASDIDRELAAWLFIRWMSEPAQQAAWTRVSGYFPVRLSATSALGDYLAKNRPLAEGFNLLDTSDLVAEPPFAGYDVVRDAMSMAYDAILDGADIDSTLAALDATAKHLYALDAAP